MAFATTNFQSLSDEPYDRLRVSWTAIFSGTLLGWAAMSLLTLIASAIGLAKLDPTSPQPGNGVGVATGVVGAVLLIATSFFGAYMAVRIAGNRRRPDALLHGALCWALSMVAGALLAMGVARTAAQSAATVASGPRAQAKVERESRARSNNGGPTAQDRENAAQASDTAAKAAGGGAGGAVLALLSSLAGAFFAARRRAGRRVDGMRRSDSRDDHPSRKRPQAGDETSVIVPPSTT
jgi:hypothetical protein